ncbi:MAG: polysaccharide biosynthesis protein [Chloroflexi bacterium]|nr:polysaccharide biosynthesis protein [Chloroflexota bacterium]
MAQPGIAGGLKGLVYQYRKLIVLLIQMGLVVVSYVGSFALRLDLDVTNVPGDVVVKTLPLLIVVRVGTLGLFRLYQGMWRYVSVVDLVQIVKATTVSSAVFAALEIPIFGLEGFPRSVFLLDWVGNIFLLGGVRLLVRVLRERFRPMVGGDGTFKRLLIIGAGDAGASLCRQALATPTLRYRPVAFVDDDPTKVGSTILGTPVAGLCRDISRVIGEYRIESAVIAIPSASPSQMRSLVELCQGTGVPFKVLPSTADILDGNVSISRIRDVDPVDLLGHPPARLDRAVIEGSIRGRRVLVTGAAGSVGSELTRQIAGFEPELLVLIDHAENPLFFLEVEIRSSFPGTPLVALVADITDLVSIGRLMSDYHPQVVYHAAAHKHVPLMEHTPGEAVKNNVGGTLVVARCAREAGVEAFVLVSTDKAVRPISVMGATKRLAELLVQEMNLWGPTRFVSVRFGNVLGSNASVVPIFKQQIARGGPVTVTHPEVRRYFMSVSEAASLILQSGAVGSGGEVFVLDMGEPVRIVALAETLITLSGLKPYEEIDIVFTGLRPGEKLSEELYDHGEVLQHADYEKLLVLNGEPHAGIAANVEAFLKDLPGLNSQQIKDRLKGLVPEYKPDGTVSSGVQSAHDAPV